VGRQLGFGWNLAVIHEVNGRMRLEFPIGKVLCETPGTTSVFFSPNADLIAFEERELLLPGAVTSPKG